MPMDMALSRKRAIPSTGRQDRLYKYVYSAGGSRDYAEAYRLFRGRDPDVRGLLDDRGLADLIPIEDGVAG